MPPFCGMRTTSRPAAASSVDYRLCWTTAAVVNDDHLGDLTAERDEPLHDVAVRSVGRHDGDHIGHWVIPSTRHPDVGGSRGH